MSATYAPVMLAMPRTSGAATVTSGAVGVPGAVYSVNAPSTKQMIPPTASRPWLVTVNSSRNRTMASRMSIRPATLRGRLPNPMNARTIAIAPTMPVTKFGLCTSNNKP